ncbi:unnamed protein product, partial [Brassica rapa subsp. trilocularis]
QEVHQQPQGDVSIHPKNQNQDLLRSVVWNPWLKQSAWIGHPSSRLEGICYNGSNRRSELSSYKTIWYNYKEWRVHDFAFGTWKNANVKSNDSKKSEKPHPSIHSEIGVFLN